MHLSTAYSYLHQCKDAIELIERAISLNPTLPELYNNYGLILTQMYNDSSPASNIIAIQYTAKIQYSNGEDSSIVRTPNDYIEKAVTQFTEAINIDPSCPLPYCNLAANSQKIFDNAGEGGMGQAMELFNKAIELDASCSEGN